MHRQRTVLVLAAAVLALAAVTVALAASLVTDGDDDSPERASPNMAGATTPTQAPSPTVEIEQPAGLSDEQLQDRALGDPAVRTHTTGKTIRKVVVAKGPLVSVVVG